LLDLSLAEEFPMVAAVRKLTPNVARHLAAWLVGLALLSACTSVPTGSVVVPGVRSCDRNGDYEQRMACSP
jgi:hypothetical protein